MTKRQAQYLETIKRLRDSVGVSPTLQEIASEMGVNINAARCTVTRLEKSGAIRVLPKVARGIIVCS